MDEPFGALDARRRMHSVLLATNRQDGGLRHHDIAEAILLADRIG